MATRRQPLGVDHLTVVPANFEGDDGDADRTETDDG